MTAIDLLFCLNLCGWGLDSRSLLITEKNILHIHLKDQHLVTWCSDPHDEVYQLPQNLAAILRAHEGMSIKPLGVRCEFCAMSGVNSETNRSILIGSTRDEQTEKSEKCRLSSWRFRVPVSSDINFGLKVWWKLGVESVRVKQILPKISGVEITPVRGQSNNCLAKELARHEKWESSVRPCFVWHVRLAYMWAWSCPLFESHRYRFDTLRLT